MNQTQICENHPRVLAITSNMGAIAELRIKNPLRALHRLHKIAGYEVADSDLSQIKDDPREYHAIIIQRIVPEYIYKAFNEQNLPYALDVDDNLLANYSYRKEHYYLGIISGLTGCAVLITPNARLVQLLEKYSGLSLTDKAAFVPNALPYTGVGNKEITQPKQILWIQSDIAALTASSDEIIRAVSDFSIKYHLPIILIGRNVLENLSLPNQVVMGEIDFISNLQLLEYVSTSIGVAPLETSADEETLDFIAGKSDLKMLLYTGYGHPGVYSRSPPYQESPFQGCGMVVSNTYSDWYDALEYQYQTGWKRIASDAEQIQQERNIDQMALDSWVPALERCILPRPMSGEEIFRMVQRVRRRYLPFLIIYKIFLAMGVRKSDLMYLHNRVYLTFHTLKRHG